MHNEVGSVRAWQVLVAIIVFEMDVQPVDATETPQTLTSTERLEQVEGVTGALAGQVIVLLAQNRALQEMLILKGVATPREVREATLNILDRELDDLADQILPQEISGPVKSTLREAVRSARSEG